MKLTKQAALEGLLFINGDNGISIKDAMFALEIKQEKIFLTLLASLQERYANNENSVFQIFRHNNLLVMRTKKAFYHYYIRFAQKDNSINLSQAALETLAIIAFKGPLTKLEIEQIRKVECSTVLNNLQNKFLVKVVGQKKEIGSPFLYNITDHFLKLFNISDVQKLNSYVKYQNETTNPQSAH